MKTTKRTAASRAECEMLGEKQLAGFIKKFDSKNAGIPRGIARAFAQPPMSWFTTITTFFVIGYCSTERPSDCIPCCSTKRVGLSFYHGATLPDPHKLLLGSGSQNRFMRIESPAKFNAQRLRNLSLPPSNGLKVRGSGRGKLVIRSISKKQKPP